ncbi:IRK-interacting protein-like [Andrographis paniculata]|uniref:IRK-interacting protein-like n=1 Tax=Andrographis paniculata TaxID=175694 RepID=UPI0021E8E44E|nr:IRK-interacting protein-like [Andrographis paniculata]
MPTPLTVKLITTACLPSFVPYVICLPLHMYFSSFLFTPETKTKPSHASILFILILILILIQFNAQALPSPLMAAAEEINGNREIWREAIQAALTKSVELRAIHNAFFMNTNSNSNSRLPLPSLASSSSPTAASAHDYPIFNPSYEDKPSPAGYRRYAESWGGLEETLFKLADDRHSLSGFRPPALAASDDCSKCRRNSLGDVRSVSSYNKCRPAASDYNSDGGGATGIAPAASRNKGLSFSWLLPKLKKKIKSESSPLCPQTVNTAEFELIESLKKKLIEAQRCRDDALIESSEMKSSVEELRRKLGILELHCEELKTALRQAVRMKVSPRRDNFSIVKTRGKSIDGNPDYSIPVSDEATIEDFLHIVSESRLSAKQFCKALIANIQATDETLVGNLNSILEPYKLSMHCKHSKAVLYHLEAVVNRLLYEDFENGAFERNGAAKFLDPDQERRSKLRAFAATRNMSRNDAQRKGAKNCDGGGDEFGKFCDRKMHSVAAALGWTRPWLEETLEAFFAAVKGVWLLHLLAFSFDPPLRILRVGENRIFESHYMDDIFADKLKPMVRSRTKIMVMPGFFVHDKVLRCKVICK